MLGGSLASLLVFVITHTASSQPAITEPGIRSTQYPFSGKEFKVRCVAVGDPPLSYTWMRNGEQVYPKANNHLSVSENGTLTFSSFSRRENGNYTCKVLNDEGYDISAVVTLIQATLHTEWNVPETEVTKSTGEPMTLECKDPPYSAPPGTFVWSVRKSSEKNHDVSLDDRVMMDSKGTLHFAFVEETDSGFYRCGIFNSRLNVRKLGSPVKVKVKREGGAPAQIEPQVIWHSKETTAVLGTEVKLECIFSGKPVPVVKWTLDGKDITTSADKDDNPNGGVLRIAVNHENDQGIYKCEGSNPVGTKQVEIKLNIVSGPLWVNAPNSQVVMEEENVTFMCKARAVGSTSDLVTSWVDVDSEATLSSDKSQVTFYNVSMGDNDCVHCSISNNIDYISKTACFRVVNDSSYLPSTTTTTWELTTQRLPGNAPATGSSPVGSLVAIIVVMLILAVVAGVGFVLWRRRQRNRVTLRLKKDDKASFEEKAKRRQTV